MFAEREKFFHGSLGCLIMWEFQRANDAVNLLTFPVLTSMSASKLSQLDAEAIGWLESWMKNSKTLNP